MFDWYFFLNRSNFIIVSGESSSLLELLVALPILPEGKSLSLVLISLPEPLLLESYLFC